MASREIVIYRVPDNCMEPTLRAHDWVLVDRGRRKIHNDQVYAIRTGNGVEILRLTMVSDWLIRVLCDNPQYPSCELNLNQVAIIGRVIYSSRIWA